MSAKSAIYEGRVRHRRYAQVENNFRYQLFMVYLDLAELDEVFRGRWLWSARRFNVAYLCREDHLGDPEASLEQAVRDLVEARTGSRPAGPIRMLTHLRYWSYCFNPVSFYYCFDPADKRVDTVVAEVNNTPWGEQYCYVLGRERDEGRGISHRYRFPKDFHVSPFMDMPIDYDWRFSEPRERLAAHMVSLDRATGERIFDATMSLKRREISGGQLARVLVAYPLITVKVIAMIHWQALRLWWKKAPFYAHPSKRKLREGSP